MERLDQSQRLAAFLHFVQDGREYLKTELASKDAPEVQLVHAAIEEHYIDNEGKPSMYQKFESALYDDARSMVTFWQFFEKYGTDELSDFQRLIEIEIQGLTGDRHPRKVFDRSPFGVVALVVGTITVWMTFLRTYTGDDLSELLELIRFNWIAGSIWIIGLFVVVWYILKTHRNNCQVAFLSSLRRAISLYLDRPA